MIRTPFIRIKKKAPPTIKEVLNEFSSEIRDRQNTTQDKIQNRIENLEETISKVAVENNVAISELKDELKKKLEEELNYEIDLNLIKGEKGDTGERGEMGIQGIQGVHGEIGEKGDKGDKGDDGYTPIKGLDYFDGEKGKDAKIDYEKILEDIVEQIKTKKLLKVEHIGNFTDGLEQTIAPIRSLAAGFRGGGDTVMAGVGITITTTTSGTKVITATDPPSVGFVLLLDDTTTANVTYIGKAAVGSATSSPVWQIQNLEEIASPETLTVTWVNSGAYDSIWDDRASLIYV
jgi:hypothetical protein